MITTAYGAYPRKSLGVLPPLLPLPMRGDRTCMLNDASSRSEALSSPPTGPVPNPKLKLPRAVLRTGSAGGVSSSTSLGAAPPVSMEERLALAVLLELEVRRKESH